jgi:hypothetical protein
VSTGHNIQGCPTNHLFKTSIPQGPTFLSHASLTIFSPDICPEVAGADSALQAAKSVSKSLERLVRTITAMAMIMLLRMLTQ